MKLNKFVMAILAGAALGTVAQAQVNVTIGGSTAIRGLLFDRITNVFSATPTISSNSASFVTFSGTVPGVAGTTVIRYSGSGSSEGLDALVNNSLQATCVNGSSLLETNRTLDVVLSDIFAESAYPKAFNSSSFNDAQVCVIPFVFMRNNSLTGISNITRDQALVLFTASGPGFDSSYFGGTPGNDVYLIGRNNLSGTRITIDKDTGFKSGPSMWQTNGAGNLVVGSGYSSGANVRDTVRNKAGTIGYLGSVIGDITSGTTTVLSYNGVPFSPANVANGSYALWGYEHVMDKKNLSADQTTVRNAIINGFTQAAFLSSPLFTNSAVSINDMIVTRQTDGAPITP